MVCGIPQGRNTTLSSDAIFHTETFNATNTETSGVRVLFLIYINDLPNFSKIPTFRIFADDTNIFANSKDPKNLKALVNTELRKVKEWCDINKLSINFKKTKYMIIKSSKKIERNIDINLTNRDGGVCPLQRTGHIKYLGVTIDNTLSWKHHIYIICLLSYCKEFGYNL